MVSSWVAVALLSAVEPLPELDVYLDSPRQLDVRAGLAAPARALLDRSHVTAVEPRRGVPTFLWAERFPGARTPRSAGLAAAEAARRHLLRFAALYRLSAETVAGLEVSEVHDRGTGAVVVGLRRAVAGVPVLRDELDVVMTPQLELVALAGSLATHRAPPAAFRLTAQTALAVAAQRLTGHTPDAHELPPLEAPRGGWVHHGPGKAFALPPRARRVFFDDGERLVPAWHLEVTTVHRAEALVVAADDGRLLVATSPDARATHSYRVYADAAAPFRPWDSPVGDAALPHPASAPTGFDPPLATPQLVALDHAGLSTADPWLPAGATSLSGNNVAAYADLAAPDGLLPDGGAGGDGLVAPSAAATFDYGYAFGAAPDAGASQYSASATQAFFVTNWLHDVFYDLGFDEAARNGQRDNFGRGGLGGDALRVEVHDYAGRNNASMRTWADGQASRMHLQLFDPPRPSTLTVTGAGFADGGLFLGVAPAVAASRAWDVTGAVEVVRDADGGAAGCDVWAGSFAGAVALVDLGGCTLARRVDHARDAGAAALLVTGGCFFTPEQALVVACLDDDAGVQLRAVREGGASASARLVRPAPGVERDGALDSTVVVHEWGHFLTSRLVGDSLGLENSPARAMGEGWSDFLTLWASLRATDTAVTGNDQWQGTFAVGGWSVSGPGFDGATLPAHYFGFRRYPYSTDRAKNPLTFRHVGTNVPLPAQTVAPRDFGGGPDNAELHNAGEVWATMLWEAQTRLLRKPGATTDAARDQMADYLVASLKATPVLPTFLEARDALLAVVAASSPTTDFPLFMDAFATRGLGVLAQSSDRRSLTNTPLAEDTTGAGGNYRLVSVALVDEAGACDDDGRLDPTETGTLTVRLMNIGTRRLTQGRLTVVNAQFGFNSPGGGVAVPANDPFTVVDVVVPVSLGTGGSGIRRETLTLQVIDPQISALQGRLEFEAPVVMNVNEVAAATEGFETGASGWVSGSSETFAWEHEWAVLPRTPAGSGFALQGRAPDGVGDNWVTSPPLAVGTGPFSFSFTHSYLFQFNPGTSEYFDGGRLEVSTDGVTFTAIPGSAVSPAYPVNLVAGTSNPLAGEAAFSGALPAPGQSVTVSLGTAYSGRTVWIRWRIGTDGAGGSSGWVVDDVAFTGLTTQPFTALVVHSGCGNRPPTLSNTSSLVVDERTLVTLVPGQTADIDGDPVTVTWMQTSGTSVQLSGDLFEAPEVPTAGAVLGFRATASDGRGGTDTEDITVRIRNVNRRPEVSVAPIPDATSGDTVTLTATGTDPDGDNLRYRWQQDGNPEVALMAADTAAATFVAPEVDIPTQLQFRVTTFDADTSSETLFLSMVVNPKPTGCQCGVVDPTWGALVVALALARRRRR